MDALIQDVRYSLRFVRKQPGTAFLAIGALVLGIGLNIAIFSVVNAVILRPLPIFQPDRVVLLSTKVNQTGSPLGTSYPDFLDWKAQAHSLEAIAAIRGLSFIMTGNGPPERLKCIAISASGFKVWGVSMVLGRDFTEADDLPGAERVVVLNNAFWQRKFGGDPSVLQKSMALDDQSYRIIGVLQAAPVGTLQYPDVWVANGPMLDQHIMMRDTRWFFPVARLKPDVSPAQAQAEMDTIASRLAAQYPDTTKGMGIRFLRLVDQVTPSGGKPLVLLIVASGAIFLLATVNVMTVFIGNAVERGQELSIRLALGSSRSNLVRQLFIQALLFAGAGSALGLLLAKLGLAFFLHRFPNAVSRFQETTIDYRVVLLTVGMALVSTLAATLAPAIYAFKLNISSELKGEWSWLALPKYRTLGRGAFILFEVTLASALSLVAGLLVQSFYEVEKVNLGFNPNQVVSFQVNLPATRYKEPAKQSVFYKLATDKLRQLPGMESISGISGLPLTTQGEVTSLDVEGGSPLKGEQLTVEYESVLPGFFRAMRLPLLQGRDFTDADHEGAPQVVIVDDVLAAKLWPGQNPVGKRTQISGRSVSKMHSLEVVGVVQEIKHFGPEAKVRFMQVYVPEYQDPSPVLSFVVNTTVPESALKTPADKALHELDKDLPIENFETMDAYLDTYLSSRKVSLLLLSGFAATGIGLGMIGIYGVVANSVIRRRREIAVRMAVGATIPRTIMLITRLGLAATVAGILIGSGIVLGLTRLLTSFLFGIGALNPGIYVFTAVIIIGLAVIASLIPAMRLFQFNIQEILRQ